jgi:UDPglucose 6-dehydrogenase
VEIAVYGMGRLGVPLASLLSRHYTVTGIDNDTERVNELRTLQAHARSGATNLFLEPDVDISSDGLSFTDEPTVADLSFIVVPTPSAADGSFSSLYVEQALSDIAKVRRKSDVAIVSTVSPGTCSRLACQYGPIVYTPSFIALGSVIHDLSHPHFLLLGGLDIGSPVVYSPVMEKVIEVQSKICDAPRHIAEFEEIELLKLSVNAALGTKISLANQLGRLFEAYGVDPKAVEILGEDQRLGTGYWTPGSPLSGPCLPRDGRALQAAAYHQGMTLPITEAVDDVNAHLLNHILSKVLKDSPASVGILGLAYKYGTDVTEASPGMWLLKQMLDREIHVRVYDEAIPSGDDLKDVVKCEVLVVTLREYEHLVEPERSSVYLWR